MKIPRFYPILDTELCARRGLDVDDCAQAILASGARILQFRHKGFFSRDILAQAGRIARSCGDAGAIFIMNDRADMGLLLDASGLHLGQDDLPPSAARHLIGPQRLLGYSTHNETQLREAASEPVDYVALGPIFSTTSKRNPDPVVGIAELRLLRRLTTKPLVAIGGITRSNARETIEAGADSVAILGDLFPADHDIKSRASDWLQLLGS